MLECKVILGLWPIAGITSGPVSKNDALATIQAAIDHGVDWFDTAYAYGFNGESDRLLGEVLSRAENGSRDLRVIGKVGQRWNAQQQRVVDCRPDQLVADTEESLQRIGIDQFDLLMLHCIDPTVPIERSAEAMDGLRIRGLAKQIGVCNVTVSQLSAFANAVDCRAMQCPLNLMQPESLNELIPAAASRGIRCDVFWVLMKGLFAGQIKRDHQFDKEDRRPTYEIYQGEWRERAQTLMDGFNTLANEHQTTVACLSIGWALSQPGVNYALIGAKRPEQIIETAKATALEPTV